MGLTGESMEQLTLRVAETHAAKARAKPHVVLVQDAIERHHGNLTEVAKELESSFAVISTMVNSSPILQTAMVGEREGLLDLAEEKLRESINTGDIKAITFALSKLGARRGYVERSEKPVRFEADNSVQAKLDPRKLSTEQLMQLKRIMASAAMEDGIIDVTPDQEPWESDE